MANSINYLYYITVSRIFHNCLVFLKYPRKMVAELFNHPATNLIILFKFLGFLEMHAMLAHSQYKLFSQLFSLFVWLFSVPCRMLLFLFCPRYSLFQYHFRLLQKINKNRLTVICAPSQKASLIKEKFSQPLLPKPERLGTNIRPP